MTSEIKNGKLTIDRYQRGAWFVGNSVLTKAKETRWWTMATFLDELLYAGRTATPEEDYHRGPVILHRGCQEFMVHARLTFSPSREPGAFKIRGRDDHWINVEEALRGIRDELERLAILEATS